MIIEKIRVGMLDTNCYYLGCDVQQQACLIDPGDDVEKIMEIVRRYAYPVAYIFLTHGHLDHMQAAAALKKMTGASIYIHPEDEDYLQDRNLNLADFFPNRYVPFKCDGFLADQDVFKVGKIELQVLHTPGHTPGSVVLVANKERQLFSGDTLFDRSVGRTDLPGGNSSQLNKSIKEKIFTLPDDYQVWPGHGEKTTLAIEKQQNPFL